MIHDLDVRSAEFDEVLNGRGRLTIPEGLSGIESGDRLRLYEWDPARRRRLDRQAVVEVADVVRAEDGRVDVVVRSMPPEEEGPVS